MKSLSEISIQRPVFAWMIMAALIVFGAISFKNLGVSQLPDVDFPVVGVSVSLPGAAPEVVEQQIIDPMEDAFMQISGVRTITSSSAQSSGSISIEFELDRNIDNAVQEVQNRIAQVNAVLPTTMLPPTVRKTNPEDQPILWLVLLHDGSVKQIDSMIYARNYLYDVFGTVPGVGDIALGGYVDPALRVWVDLKKMNNYNLTADDLIASINAEHVEIPVGRIENDKKESNIRIMGEAKSPEEFGKILLNNRQVLGASFKPIPLKAIADIEEGTVDIRRISRFNGKDAVGLGILKQHGSNAVEVANAVRAKLAEVQKTLPKEYNLTLRSDSTRFIKQSVDELNFMIILSALLTSIVCFFFLGSWTSTMNVLMAIPTSIVGTFMAINFFGFTLNTFTLLGLSLAIGIVVDDAIMMLENIVRHRELGEKRKAAALKGAKEITFAALAATIAICAIFLPVIFMKGVIGRYFYQYGITVSAAVLLSLLEALTLTPMRCSQYLKVNHSEKGLSAIIDRVFKKLSTTYQKILSLLLRHRIKTIMGAFVLFVLSLLIGSKIPSEMMPAQDQSQMLFRFKGPVGSSIGRTSETFKIAEDYFLKQPEVDGNYTVVGGFGGDAVNQGIMFINLVEPAKRKRSQSELMKLYRKELKEKIPDMEIVAQDLSLRGFASSRGFPVEFIVQGPDWDKLTESTEAFMAKLKKSGLVTDLNTDVQAGMPEVKITPNRKKMAEYGVSITSVTNALNTLVGGALLNGTTEYEKAGHRYTIEVRLKADQRNKESQLKNIYLRNSYGELVQLSNLVDIDTHLSLMYISRMNRARAITVYGNPAPGHSQQDVLTAIEKQAKEALPPGYSLKLSGSAQSFKESFQSLLFALLLGILVSYMVLASQFDSFLHPVTVLMALPFSFSGAFVALYLCHQTINIFSLIGLILLMGIVKKNSILLVDFTNQCRKEGLNVLEALLHACPVRLRPILMTSTAMIAGALPEALSVGPGAETTIPMAIAIIGGLIASTILTLFVVPCVYSLLSHFEKPDPLASEDATA